MTDYEWTEEMGEVSGFGGEYEEACREMVRAGARWVDEHPEADPTVLESPGVYGVTKADNDAAGELQDAMADAASSAPSGAMMHAATRAVLYIKENGWDSYVAAMEDGNE